MTDAERRTSGALAPAPTADAHALGTLDESDLAPGSTDVLDEHDIAAASTDVLDESDIAPGSTDVLDERDLAPGSTEAREAAPPSTEMLDESDIETPTYAAHADAAHDTPMPLSVEDVDLTTPTPESFAVARIGVVDDPTAPLPAVASHETSYAFEGHGPDSPRAPLVSGGIEMMRVISVGDATTAPLDSVPPKSTRDPSAAFVRPGLTSRPPPREPSASVPPPSRASSPPTLKVASAPPPTEASPEPRASQPPRPSTPPPERAVEVDVLAKVVERLSVPPPSVVPVSERDVLDDVASDAGQRLSEPPAEVDPSDVLSSAPVARVPSQPPAPPKDAPPPRAPRPAEKPAEKAVEAASTTEPPPPKRRQRPWWEEAFGDDFIRTLGKVTDAQIAREATFIEESLGVERGGVLLDLACGTGRHAVELASRGYNVVGYDLSVAMLARAADCAQEREQKINFLQGDMREMGFVDMFDGVFSWSTSFGYFDDERNLLVAQRIHRALRKGGTLLLDVVNRDYVIARQPSLVWFEGESCVCIDDSQIDYVTNRLRVKRTVMLDDGRTREVDYAIRLYSLHELGRLLHDAGFRVAEVTGNLATPGVFFGADSPRLVVLAQKI